jgi:hypothetical protein
MRRSDVKTAATIESVADARDLAARRLPKGIFQMFEAGSGSNATMDENAQAFRDIHVPPPRRGIHVAARSEHHRPRPRDLDAGDRLVGRLPPGRTSRRRGRCRPRPATLGRASS